MYKIFNFLLLGLLLFRSSVLIEGSAKNDDENIIEDDESLVQVEEDVKLPSAKEGRHSDKEGDAEEDAKPPTSLPDADTYLLFVEPTVVKDLTAGKMAKFLASFRNAGKKDLVVERIDVSFRYPMDYSFYIQNYTDAVFNRPVLPDTEATFDYSFVPSDAYIGRPLGLSINMHYFDENGTRFFNSVFNETVNIVEDESGFNPETGFLYIIFGCLVVLLLVLGQQFLSKMRKKHGMTKKPVIVEMGTIKNGDIDYDWIPKELLQPNKNTQQRRDVRNHQIRKDQ